MNVIIDHRNISAQMRDIIVRSEIDAGNVEVKSAEWLNADEWKDFVITQSGRRIRLVLLYAKRPCTGAFTRLIAGIDAAGLTPVIVEPCQSLVDWCNRHDYRCRKIGRGDRNHTQEIWYRRGRS